MMITIRWEDRGRRISREEEMKGGRGRKGARKKEKQKEREAEREAGRKRQREREAGR